MRALVVGKGSREQFLAARALNQRGAFAHLLVDWYAPKSSWLTRALERAKIPVFDRALAVRAAGIDRNQVTCLRSVGLRDRLRLECARRLGGMPQAILRGDIAFARAAARAKVPEYDVFFGYSYASLEAMEVAKRRGAFCVLDQIDPGEKEHEIIRAEEAKWPEYVRSRRDRVPAMVYERLHREWALADLIIVNSEWSRQCNIEKGAPAEKIEVLPLAYEAAGSAPAVSVRPAGAVVDFLWLGRVTLQKGIQYLVQAAEQLQAQPVRFLVAGVLEVSPRIQERAPANIVWLDRVTRARKAELLRDCEAFLLPTLSDGFALTQLEAFGAGLPVIATTHCGRVVEDGRTGFVIPAGDPSVLAEAIVRFADDPNLKHRMGPACRSAVVAYSVERYADQLIRYIEAHRAVA